MPTRRRSYIGDIKPSNVLVSVQGETVVPKIIDFGVAKATEQRLTEKTVFTERGQILGTPEYMSPEQAEMGARGIDTRTDIYSLGVLLYELLAGGLPFDSKQIRQAGYAEMQRIIREVEPPKPSIRASDLMAESQIPGHMELRSLGRQLRGDLDWITMKAMAKDRERRYSTASEIVADIRRHLSNRPVVAGPPSAIYRLRKFIRKNRGPVGAVAAVLLALALGAGGEREPVQRIRDAPAADRISAPRCQAAGLCCEYHGRCLESRAWQSRGVSSPTERVSGRAAKLGMVPPPP